ncbi:MAG: hypothetical protein AUJ92_05885 [Armatimonadetes bacterium CG2_30_59_28]|nr:DUF4838 domain-containing protein [Armatimonadota bacterium]OIO96463.1 MAG: hypothetical protein AUJ92_05885 [Armatimonadetes bacterium CG2_30_59_28]PIU67016.1 MAG: hypothetical protein COS85_02295 [Armatimonadetes bacterium CG07_land_8_20_14_0_80_59_28]
MDRKLKLWLTSFLISASIVASAEDYALVTDGKATSCIVLPDNAGPVEKYAASELAFFLQRVSGAAVHIVDSTTKGLCNVYLGTTEAKTVPRSAAIDKAVSQLQDDGFFIAADAKRIRVIGRKPVGVLYGVYHLLKAYAGMRWFYPGADGEHCPRKTTITVPKQVTVSNPSFQHREIGFICANVNSKTVDTRDWMARNGIAIQTGKHIYRMLQLELEKRGAESHDGGHCFSYLLSDDLFTEHPEYFPLIDGKRVPQEWRRQPCTSNPAVAEIMAEGIREVLDALPTGGSYLIGNNDDTRWCQCDNCTRLDPPEEKQKGFVSTRYYTFINQIADKVYATHPGADLWAWAYQNYRMPPTGVVPDKRLSVEACVHHRCYRHSLADETCAANDMFREMLTGWRKLGLPVKSREYNECLPGDPAYVPFERVYCEDLKYYYRLGMSGFRIPIPPPDGTFGPTWNNRRTLNAWYSHWQALYLAALLGWDINTKYAEAIEDMGSKYYGPAWPAMQQYRELLVQTYETTPGHIIYGTPDMMMGKCLERPGVQSRLNSLLTQAEKAAARDELVLKRVRRDGDFFRWCWEGSHQEYLSKRPKETSAGRRAGKMVVDGSFDEEDWRKVEFTTNFIVNDGETAAEPQTYVKMLYDADNLYFAVEAMEPQTGKLKAASLVHDGPQLWGDSTVEFFIAVPEVDGLYTQIAVTPKGTVYDARVAPSQAADLTFDSGAEIKTVVLADRWVVEARIPAASLGRTIRDGETWKVNVARNRKLVDDTKSQASSWSNGAFHGSDAYRPVVFGETALINNGDFEVVVKASEKVKLADWKFADDLAPVGWNFTGGGTAAVIDGGAASGRRFYRGRGWVFQLINFPAEYRDNLRIRLKARGKGTLQIALFQYDRKSGRHIDTVILETAKLDAGDWAAFGAAHKCDDDKVLRLAFHLQGAIDLDDVSVTPEVEP